MKKAILNIFILALFVLNLGIPSVIQGQIAPVADQGALPNFDVRVDESGRSVLRSLALANADPQRENDIKEEMAAAQEVLGTSIPGLHVERHTALGGPAVVGARGGFLTGRAPSADPEQTVRNFLFSTSALYGLSPGEADGLVAKARYTNPAGNLSWVTLRQQINGIPVFRGEVRAAVTANGELAALSSELAAGLDSQSIGAPTMTPEQAIQIAAENIGVTLTTTPAFIERSVDGLKHRFERGPFADDVTAELVVFPVSAGKAVLAWQILLWQDVYAYYVVVDDASGQVLFRKNITNHQTQTATFEVYASDSPAPLSPSNATPANHKQGASVARTQFTLISEDPSNDLGWIPDGSCVTTGNNVDAGLDIFAPNGIDAAGRANGVAGGASPSCRNFIFGYNPPPGGVDSPTGANYRNGVVTNLFFWSNRFHDRLYSLGFTEAAGNFQNNNFGRGGLGGDFVRAEAQDFGGTNNANFATPSDGTLPRMQMYLFTGPNPDRDGSLDQEIVIHELTHGLSNRLVGNALGLDNIQGIGMGEGWSDFYALALLSEAADNPNGVYAAGGYSTLNLGGFAFKNNYFYGIRRYPYTTNMKLNPMTFADIDPGQIKLKGGKFPASPFSRTGHANEVHNVGEIWALMLWEGRANFIARLGSAAGNEQMLQVVTDGLKLTPNSPTFIQARNAILQATCAGFTGTDEIDLWRGFAKRGMGASAVGPPSNASTTGVREAFDLPLVNGAAVLDDTAGNGNGFVDPGETITLTIPALNNFNCANLTAVTGALSDSTAGVTVTDASGDYGAILAGDVSNGTSYQFTVAATVACGAEIRFTLILTSAEGVSSTHTIKMRVGQSITGIANTYTYGGAPKLIPNGIAKGTIATLNVPGKVVIGDVNLNLINIPHTWIGDLVISLIGPDGTVVGVVDNLANGFDDNSNNNFTNTVLDDEAVTPIQTQSGPVTNASFQPTNPLSVFDLRKGNGKWKLKVSDTFPLDQGIIQSWSLTITPVTFTCSP